MEKDETQIGGKMNFFPDEIPFNPILRNPAKQASKQKKIPEMLSFRDTAKKEKLLYYLPTLTQTTWYDGRIWRMVVNSLDKVGNVPGNGVSLDSVRQDLGKQTWASPRSEWSRTAQSRASCGHHPIVLSAYENTYGWRKLTAVTKLMATPLRPKRPPRPILWM